MSWITPVTNRTSQDVDNAKTYRTKLQNGDTLTSDEYAVLDKGCITHETLNRIENNQQVLKTLLNEAGYWSIPIQNKTNWTINDILHEEDWERIVQNETVLKNAFYIYTTTPTTPNYILYYTNINDLEKILLDLNTMIYTMKTYYRECNTFECGED